MELLYILWMSFSLWRVSVLRLALCLNRLCCANVTIPKGLVFLLLEKVDAKSGLRRVSTGMYFELFSFNWMPLPRLSAV